MSRILFGILILCWSCSQSQNQEEINIIPASEIKLTFNGVPDSVLVESSAEFTFRIDQEGNSQGFEVSIDTIIPAYSSWNWIDWNKVPEGEDQIPEDAIIKIFRRGVSLTINDNPLEKNMIIQAGRMNHIQFSNPAVVGNYRLIFNIRGNGGKVYKQELQLKAYSPEIKIYAFNVDPWLDLEIWDKDFFNVLNDRYSFHPLSSVFIGKEVDTLFSNETPKPGYEGQLTFPGLGITIYFEQENGKTFSYQSDESDLNVSFYTTWDNDVKHPAITLPQYSGFHCLEFTSWEFAKSGNFSVVLSLTDYWGKTANKTIYLKAVSGR